MLLTLPPQLNLTIRHGVKEIPGKIEDAVTHPGYVSDPDSDC
jgi:hypothetical protein